jgi:hypothetical protein
MPGRATMQGRVVDLRLQPHVDPARAAVSTDIDAHGTLAQFEVSSDSWGSLRWDFVSCWRLAEYKRWKHWNNSFARGQRALTKLLADVREAFTGMKSDQKRRRVLAQRRRLG